MPPIGGVAARILGESPGKAELFRSAKRITIEYLTKPAFIAP